MVSSEPEVALRPASPALPRFGAVLSFFIGFPPLLTPTACAVVPNESGNRKDKSTAESRDSRCAPRVRQARRDTKIKRTEKPSLHRIPAAVLDSPARRREVGAVTSVGRDQPRNLDATKRGLSSGCTTFQRKAPRESVANNPAMRDTRCHCLKLASACRRSATGYWVAA